MAVAKLSNLQLTENTGEPHELVLEGKVAISRWPKISAVIQQAERGNEHNNIQGRTVKRQAYLKCNTYCTNEEEKSYIGQAM